MARHHQARQMGRPVKKDASRVKTTKAKYVPQPKTPCATCGMSNWRRVKPKDNAAWYCLTCRNQKITAAAKARAVALAAQKAAEFEAKRATLPRYQQAIYRGDALDMQIWKFFTHSRLCLEWTATGHTSAEVTLFDNLEKSVNLIRGIVDGWGREGIWRLHDVVGQYIYAARKGDPNIGNPSHPPWYEDGKSPFTRR